MEEMADIIEFPSLDQTFIKNAPATFFVKAGATSKNFPIVKNDLLLIDKALDPIDGDLVIAIISNEFRIAQYKVVEGRGVFYPFNKVAGEDELGEDFVWGVISSIHREFRS